MMVEAGAQEVSEKEMLDAIMFAHEEIKKIVSFIEDIAKDCGKEKRVIEYYAVGEDVMADVRAYADDMLNEALGVTTNRLVRTEKVDEVEANCLEHFAEKYEGREQEIKDALYKMKKEKVRANIINDGIRQIGRAHV